MKNRIKMLKVKIKSLAAEARIIRLEERRAKGRRTKPGEFRGRDDEKRQELYWHRVRDVRREQRHSLLAYAFLRGRPLAKVERPYRCRLDLPDWDRVAKLVEKFGTTAGAGARGVQATDFAIWRAAAVLV